MAGFGLPGLGWKRDAPDFRDFIPGTPQVEELLGKVKRKRSAGRKKVTSQDLREYFPEPYHQKGIDASPAHACVGLVEYFRRRLFGQTLPPSRLFLHQCTRKLMRAECEVGADLRTTLKAMVRFGLPPERYWGYDPGKLNAEPDAFLFSFTDEYESLCYFRLDGRNTAGSQTLETVKAFLSAGFPCVFGFPVPASVSRSADIPFRPTFDATTGGQAVIAVGFDDRRPGPTRGALLVRNSWGAEWGEEGYGWLPYVYVQEQLAVDFWTLIQPQWLETGEVQRPELK